MIISTVTGRPFLIRFMIFNFIAFCIFKLTLLNNITQYSLKEFVLVILLSLITSISNIFINIKVSDMYEKEVIRTSSYDEEYGCNLFDYYNTKFIFELKENNCNIYIHEKYIIYLYDKYCIPEYLLKLKLRMLNLNKKDMFCIYCYKYFSNILLSMAFFAIWNSCSIVNGSDTFLNNLVEICIISFVLMFIFFIVNEILYLIISRIMKKRNLGFLIYK